MVAYLCGCNEVPLLLVVNGGDLNAAGDGVAAALHDFFQGALNAVINIFNHAGSQLDAQGEAGGFHRNAGAKAGGFLVDLNGGCIAAHLDDLTDQTLRTYADYVIHIGVRQTLGNHQRTGNLDNSTGCHSLSFLYAKFRFNSPIKVYLRLLLAPQSFAVRRCQDQESRICRES